MDRIENHADAAVSLQNALRVLALDAESQIALFDPACVACQVRVSLRIWKEQFSDSPLASEMTVEQRDGMERFFAADEAVGRDPAFECNENRYVRESKAMQSLRRLAAEALASFEWETGIPVREWVAGTLEFGQRREKLVRQRKQDRLAARRMEPATPHFHSATFELLGHPSQRNQVRVEQIGLWEEQHQIRMPVAVREWYEFEGPDLWERVIPRDCVGSLEKVVPEQPARVRGLNEDDTFFCMWSPANTDVELVARVETDRYLFVNSDTDVGIPCFARIDGSHDPPVYIKPEGSFDPPLLLASPMYSSYQFDRLADEQFSPYRSGCIRHEVEHPLPSERDLAHLAAHMSEGPRTSGGWLGWHYRFFADDVLCTCGISLYDAHPSVWVVAAHNEQAWAKLLAILEPISDLVGKLR